MEQQNIPNTQFVYLTQAPKEKRDKDLKDAYNVKATRILGVVHIVCGLIAFSSEIQVIENGYHRDVIGIGTGIWTSVFFFVSGGLSIKGAQSGSKRLVVSTMVMSILSAVCAGVLLIMSSMGHQQLQRLPKPQTFSYRLCDAGPDGFDNADRSHYLSRSHMQASMLPLR